jgi:formate/nitrite transporter
MLRTLTLLVALSTTATAFSPAGLTRVSTRVTTGINTALRMADNFDTMVTKTRQGYKQDIEERSERISLDITKTTYTQLVKSAPDAYISFAEKGASNAHLPKRKIFHQSVLGGCYVGFGGLISLMIAGNLGGLGVASPGVAKMAFAALFPVNLLLIVSTQGQLFTGNSATVAAAKFEGFVTTKDLLYNWGISLAGNIVGCGLFAGATILGQIMNPGARALCISTAVAKTSAPLVPTLIKAIMCNWMVSMAVFLSGAANDMCGKLVGCWFPISTFVGIGLEHSIANLFIIPLALMVGAPISIGAMITKNLIPVIIGNGIAGSLIVAASYSYQFGRLGGLRRAIFKEKLANIQLQLAKQRKEMDKQLKAEINDALSD